MKHLILFIIISILSLSGPVSGQATNDSTGFPDTIPTDVQKRKLDFINKTYDSFSSRIDRQHSYALALRGWFFMTVVAYIGFIAKASNGNNDPDQRKRKLIIVFWITVTFFVFDASLRMHRRNTGATRFDIVRLFAIDNEETFWNAVENCELPAITHHYEKSDGIVKHRLIRRGKLVSAMNGTSISVKCR
jgi:hypothetical protein